jgi:hypothetical protein
MVVSKAAKVAPLTRGDLSRAGRSNTRNNHGQSPRPGAGGGDIKWRSRRRSKSNGPDQGRREAPQEAPIAFIDIYLPDAVDDPMVLSGA